MLTILHTESSIGWGGQEIRILTEALHLKARGHHVIIGCLHKSQLYERALRAGLPVIPIPFKRAISPQAVWHVYRILRREKVEILNTHSSVDSWVASFAARMAGIPIVRTRHLSVPLRRNPVSRLVYSYLCDRIITTGEVIRGLLIRELRLDPLKVIAIPTGVDLDRFDLRKVRGEGVRADLGLEASIPLVGMVAVLRSWKGHRLFLEAAPLIQKMIPQVRFLIVGDGPQRANIQRWIEAMGLTGVVIMAGHREDIPEVFAALDVVVSASTQAEGVPQTILQALAMERSVVATEVGGVPEVIRDGETGLLIPPGDHWALAGGVVRLLKDKETALGLGRRGRRLVEQQYGLETMLDRLEVFYQELLDRPRKRS
ncbi:MAG: glycosyltransferase family 4 protein [Candidatus Methylomirabilales bacterium]